VDEQRNWRGRPESSNSSLRFVIMRIWGMMSWCLRVSLGNLDRSRMEGFKNGHRRVTSRATEDK
jgi:hypothetical protein